MKFINESQVFDQLRAGRRVEQIWPLRSDGDLPVIEYVSVYKDRDGSYTVWHCVAENIGSEDYLDVYEFPGLDPDYPEGAGSSFETLESAVEHCYSELNASKERWLGHGMIQDHYLAMLRT